MSSKTEGFYLDDPKIDEALDTLEAMVREHCENEDGYVYSLDSIANANAMRLLAKYGRIKVYSPCPGKAKGAWVKKEG